MKALHGLSNRISPRQPGWRNHWAPSVPAVEINTETLIWHHFPRGQPGDRLIALDIFHNGRGSVLIILNIHLPCLWICFPYTVLLPNYHLWTNRMPHSVWWYFTQDCLCSGSVAMGMGSDNLLLSLYSLPFWCNCLNEQPFKDHIQYKVSIPFNSIQTWNKVPQKSVDGRQHNLGKTMYDSDP